MSNKYWNDQTTTEFYGDSKDKVKEKGTKAKQRNSMPKKGNDNAKSKD